MVSWKCFGRTINGPLAALWHNEEESNWIYYWPNLLDDTESMSLLWKKQLIQMTKLLPDIFSGDTRCFCKTYRTGCIRDKVSQMKRRKVTKEVLLTNRQTYPDIVSQTKYHRRGSFWWGVNDRPPLLLLHISALRKWFLTSCTQEHPIKLGWPHSRYCVHRTFQQLLATLCPLYFLTPLCSPSPLSPHQQSTKD